MMAKTGNRSDILKYYYLPQVIVLGKTLGAIDFTEVLRAVEAGGPEDLPRSPENVREWVKNVVASAEREGDHPEALQAALERAKEQVWKLALLWRGEAQAAALRKLERTQGLAEESPPRKDPDDLFVQNQLLQSQVAEARRTAAREMQRYDQLFMLHCELQAKNDALQKALASHVQGTPCMSETYEGLVAHRHAGQVVVVYENGDDLVEQQYEESQFASPDKVPDVGDRVAAHVSVIKLLPKPPEEPAEETVEIEQGRFPKRKVITGPHEF